MINSNILFVGAMAILAVLIIIASLHFYEKGERVFKKLSPRGWNYYRNNFIFIEQISKSDYYKALKDEEIAKRKRREHEDKLRNE